MGSAVQIKMLPWRSQSNASQLAAQASSVKKGLLAALTEAVSELQYEFRNTNRAIESTDVVGRLCTALEAMFVHGLKATFLGRLSSRLSTAELGTSSPRMPEPSFWTFALVFSHKAVINQVESQSQISTEVGRARAWLRQAINDGLLVSYLTAMIADQVSLSVHYERHAFLRDSEMRDLGLSFLTGIEVYSFRLSVNVSTLNRWQPPPLSLAGIWKGPITTALDTDAEDAAASLVGEEVEEVVGKKVPGFARTLAEPILSPGGNQGGYLRRGLINEDEALRLILASTPVAFSPDDEVFTDSSTHPPSEEHQLVKHEEESPGHNLLVPDTRVASRSPSPEPVGQSYRSVTVSPALEWDKEYEKQEQDDNILSTSLAEEMRLADLAEVGCPEQVDEPSLELEEKESEIFPEAGSPEESPPVDVSVEDEEDGYNSIGTPDSSASCRCSSTGPQPDCQVCCHPVVAQRPFLLAADLTPSAGPGGDLISLQSQRVRRLERGLGFGSQLPHVRISSLSLTQNIALTSCLDLVAQEAGLDSQEWMCQDCTKAIGSIFGPGRLCELTKKYFCADCHTDQDTAVIPARLLYNWDCNQYKVSQSSALFLRHVALKPIIDIRTFNPALSKFVPELATSHHMRKQLTYLSAYLSACARAGQQGVQVSLAEAVWPREYLYSGTDMYSVRDLEQLHSGELLNTLRGAVDMCINHVMSCLVCSGRGFLCELCEDKRPVYPFNLDTVAQCADCHTVFHEKCSKNQTNCPKCERIEARSLNLLVSSTKLNRETLDL